MMPCDGVPFRVCPHLMLTKTLTRINTTTTTMKNMRKMIMMMVYL